MKRCLLGVGLAGLALWVSQSANADVKVTGRVLVRVASEDDAAGRKDIESVCAENKTERPVRTAKKGMFAVKTPKGENEQTFADKLRRDGRVRFAEPDHLLGLPEVNGKPFHFPFDRASNPVKFNNQPAIKQINLGALATQTTGLGATIAVLDTGVLGAHPVIKGKTLPGMNFVSQGLPPADVQDTPNGGALGHGTMVAGLIARLAPKSRILPVRVLNSAGVGSLMDVIQGVQYAIGQGAQVINMSFGTNMRSEILEEVLEEAAEAGVILVASAGNEGSVKLTYPAAFRFTLSVGAISANDVKADFSNYGKALTIMAPGVAIHSAFADGTYAAWSGTSFAAPFVSALAALLVSRYPNRPNVWIEDQIRESARRIDKANPLLRGQIGRGAVNFEEALKGIR